MQFSIWTIYSLAVALIYVELPEAHTQFLKTASNRTNVVCRFFLIKPFWVAVGCPPISPESFPLKILIGHIGAIGAMPNYEKVLDLARQELLDDGTLEMIISRNGCGEAFEGVAAAADLYHIEHINAFLGPYCNAGKLNQFSLAARKYNYEFRA
ncbi:hypothetical protein COOONC_26771 [Cooperia oncophora]